VEWFAKLILLPVHLICMNVAAAGPLVCIWLDGKSSRSDAAATAQQYLARWAWRLILVGAVSGLALGWLAWDAEYAAQLRRFSARITWGLAEFVFSAAILGSYAVWVTAQPRPGSATRWCRAILALAAATNLLYHFPPLFTLIANAAAKNADSSPVDSATFRRLLVSAEVLAMTTHFLLASLAVTGMTLMTLALRRGTDAAHGQRVAGWGSSLALAATALQFPSGLWLMLSLPAQKQQRLLGHDGIATSLFGVSVLVAFWLLHALAAVALGESTAKRIGQALGGMLVVIVCMCAVLQRLNS